MLPGGVSPCGLAAGGPPAGVVVGAVVSGFPLASGLSGRPIASLGAVGFSDWFLRHRERGAGNKGYGGE